MLLHHRSWWLGHGYGWQAVKLVLRLTQDTEPFWAAAAADAAGHWGPWIAKTKKEIPTNKATKERNQKPQINTCFSRCIYVYIYICSNICSENPWTENNDIEYLTTNLTDTTDTPLTIQRTNERRNLIPSENWNFTTTDRQTDRRRREWDQVKPKHTKNERNPKKNKNSAWHLKFSDVVRHVVLACYQLL